ncbi:MULTISPECIES: glutamate racemase [Prochlorococcus]|uniref:glutamate racemase n=1 Tax=Prochlorococcus TaxID=1218 RepID=UPI000533BD7C|nr:MULTISPECIES: glutamate racemase [Prochlorococcus]KGG12314.1 Glutamate racemase [Prochlorococcus sp. MIT 0601]
MTSTLGLFDSGVGGFSVLKSILQRHANLNAIYLGDTARIPYGTRSSTEIRDIALEVVKWLDQQEISALVVACNTTNSLAMDIVKEHSSVPVFGLIDSISKCSLKSRIGVLATTSTAKSHGYTKKIKSINPDIFVIEQGCPAFVPLIETGQINTEDMYKYARKYLEPLIQSDVEIVLFGCSHYPLLANILRELLPKNIELLNPAIDLAKRLDDLFGIPSTALDTPPSFSNVSFSVTSDPEGFASRAQYWLGIRPKVELVSLRKKACVF